MTQKEKLYEQLLIASNELKFLKGKSESVVNIEEIKRDRSFSAYARMHSLAELKESLEDTNNKIEKVKAEKAREEYWERPENAMRRQELEEELAGIEDDMLFNRDKYASDAISLLKENLREEWKVEAYSIDCLTIYLTDEEGKRIFGHDFEIRYADRFNCKTRDYCYYITSNIGTMGSFDVINNANRVNLYSTFGSIISNKALMSELLDMMNEYRIIINELRDRRNTIQEELTNPEIK